MNVNEIQEKLDQYYEEAAKLVNWETADNNELERKLLYTTEQFARSFEYELPREHNIKGKTKRFVQKVIRKLTRFLTRPYAEQNLKFQESLCELVGQIIEEKKQLSIDISNSQALLEKSIRLQNENYECIKDQENKVVENTNKIYSHEEAIYKLTNEVNKEINFALDVSHQVSELKDDFWGGEDTSFKSYSQAGEDAIVWFLLNYENNNQKIITYLDIGCNEYKNLSNTYAFYQMGCRGVLVDANPKFAADIKKYRKEDIFLNVGIGDNSSEHMTFYVTNDGGLSSFDKDAIEHAKRELDWLEVNEIEVPIAGVNEIIEKNFTGTPTFVSLDVEGLEMPILQAFDFEKYRPYIFIIETIEYSKSLVINKKRKDIFDFMKSKGYEEYAFTGINSIFVDVKKEK